MINSMRDISIGRGDAYIRDIHLQWLCLLEVSLFRNNIALSLIVACAFPYSRQEIRMLCQMLSDMRFLALRVCA